MDEILNEAEVILRTNSSIISFIAFRLHHNLIPYFKIWWIERRRKEISEIGAWSFVHFHAAYAYENSSKQEIFQDERLESLSKRTGAGDSKEISFNICTSLWNISAFPCHRCRPSRLSASAHTFLISSENINLFTSNFSEGNNFLLLAYRNIFHHTWYQICNVESDMPETWRKKDRNLKLLSVLGIFFLLRRQCGLLGREKNFFFIACIHNDKLSGRNEGWGWP